MQFCVALQYTASEVFSLCEVAFGMFLNVLRSLAVRHRDDVASSLLPWILGP